MAKNQQAYKYLVIARDKAEKDYHQGVEEINHAFRKGDIGLAVEICLKLADTTIAIKELDLMIKKYCKETNL